MTYRSIVLLLLVACYVGCQNPFLHGQEGVRPLWEAKPIMAQPFESHPFHAIRVPDWVSETLGCGYTLSVMNSEQRKSASLHGVTLSELGFVDPFFTYYESQYLKRRSPHVPRDQLERDIAEYRSLGVKILAVYPPCLQSEAYELHPDWRRIATNTTDIPSVDLKKEPHGGMLCLLGPYGDFFIDVLTEITSKFPDVAAFSFDGLHYGGVCYCQHCREKYRAETGKEIPNANMELPEFRRYQHWADRQMESLVERMQTRLKAIRPDIALVTWSTNAGRFGHFLSVPRNMPSRMNLLLDAPDQEFWMDESNRGNTILPALTNAYIWSTTNHRVAFSEPYLLSHGNPYGKDSFPPHEIARRMLLAATWGATPSIAVSQPARIQNDLYEVMDQLQARKPWLIRKSPEPWAAILLSDNSRNFYGRDAGQIEDRYLANVAGLFRACVEEHLPVQIISDWNLNENELAKFAVVALPNAACLDEKQLGALDMYVRRGGGIVSSLDVSRCDEFGDPRSEFGLTNVLGVRFVGAVTDSANEGPAKEDIDVNFLKALSPEYWAKRKNIFDVAMTAGTPIYSKKLEQYVGTEPVTLKGPAVRVEVDDENAQTWATLRLKNFGNQASVPAIVANQYHSGRSVYFAAGMDAGYYLYSYPYQRLAITEAMRWAAQKPPPIHVNAPMCVHATIMRQSIKGHDRLVIHLFNDINTTAFHAFANDDVPLREETIPIHDISISIDASYSVESVRLQPDGILLKVQEKDSKVTIVVPKLEVHSMVVIDLKQ